MLFELLLEDWWAAVSDQVAGCARCQSMLLHWAQRETAYTVHLQVSISPQRVAAQARLAALPRCQFLMMHDTLRVTTHTTCLQDLVGTHPDLAAGFARCQFLVLDEADRLLESSFEAELRGILQFLPARRQTLLFSATMTKSLVSRSWHAQNVVPRAACSLRGQVGLHS